MHSYLVKASGAPRLYCDGVDITPRRKKSLVLLAYLYFADADVTADRLAELLWPDNPSNRANLRTEISILNRAVGERVVERYDAVIRIRPDLWICSDIDGFLSAVEPSSLSLEELRAIVGRFCGDFLAGMFFRDAADLELWISARNAALSVAYEMVVRELITRLLDSHHPEEAVRYARGLVSRNPEDETARAILNQAFGAHVAAKHGRPGQRTKPVGRQNHPFDTADERSSGSHLEATGRPARTGRVWAVILSSAAVLVSVIALVATARPKEAPAVWDASVAVLPAEAAAGVEPGLSYRIADLLRASLSLHKELAVMSSESVYRHVSSTSDPVGSAIDAEYVVHGSLRLERGEPIVNLGVLHTHTGSRVWSYECSASSIVDPVVVRRVTNSILNAIGVSVGHNRRPSKIAYEREFDDLRSYEFYARTRWLYWTYRTRQMGALAMNNVTSAIHRLGPHPILLEMSGRIQLDYLEYVYPETWSEYIPQVESTVDRIFALDPQSPYGYSLRGRLNVTKGDLDQAARDYRQALHRDPNHPEALHDLVVVLLNLGLLDEASAHARRLELVDPLAPSTWVIPGLFSYFTGRFGESLSHYERYRSQLPSDQYSNICYPWLLYQAGRHEEALAVLHDYGFHGAYASSHIGLFARVLYHALRGERKEMEALLDFTRDDFRLGDLRSLAERSLYYSFYLAIAYALLDEPDIAVSWLRKSVEHGWLNHVYTSELDTAFTRLRGYPPFEELCAEMRDRQAKLRI